MSTQDIPDNELDDFFRKSLEEPEIDFREEDWMDMEKKLATGLGRKVTFRRYLYSLLAALFTTGGLLYMWLNLHTPDNQTFTIQASGKQTIDTSKPTETKVTGKQETKAAPEKGTQQAVAQREEAVPSVLTEKSKGNPSDTKAIKDIEGSPIVKGAENEKQNQLPNKALPSKAEKEDKPSVSLKQNQKETDVANNVGISPDTDSQLQPNKPISDNYRKPGVGNSILKQPESTATLDKSSSQPPFISGLPSGNTKLPEKIGGLNKDSTANWDTDKETDTNPVIAEQKEYVTKGTVIPTDATAENIALLSLVQVSFLPTDVRLHIKYKDELINKTVDTAGAVKPSTEQRIDPRKLAKERVNYKYSLAFMLSPDISTVRLSQLTKPGTNLGISMEYHFSRKLSVSAGIIRSVKIYDARIGDYSPPPGQWIYYTKPVKIEGDCKIWDIPINIRYNIIMNEQYNLFASAGLSSYLMQKEYYRYIYDVDDTHLRKSWQVENQNKHFLKIYNLSAGYERKISNHFSLQAEPFIKIPAAGVGFGKIKLWSGGVLFSARYRFGK